MMEKQAIQALFSLTGKRYRDGQLDGYLSMT
jgi:hypothetical protein